MRRIKLTWRTFYLGNGERRTRCRWQQSASKQLRSSLSGCFRCTAAGRRSQSLIHCHQSSLVLKKAQTVGLSARRFHSKWKGTSAQEAKLAVIWKPQNAIVNLNKYLTIHVLYALLVKYFIHYQSQINCLDLCNVHS